jgi:hypothetical protein
MSSINSSDKSITFNWLGARYRFTFVGQFKNTTGLIKIERMEYTGWWIFKSWKWKQIYMGHTTPIERALEHYKNSLENE